MPLAQPIPAYNSSLGATVVIHNQLQGKVLTSLLHDMPITFGNKDSFHNVITEGPSWSYSSWIYNYLCNQYLSPLTL